MLTSDDVDEVWITLPYSFFSSFLLNDKNTSYKEQLPQT